MWVTGLYERLNNNSGSDNLKSIAGKASLYLNQSDSKSLQILKAGGYTGSNDRQVPVHCHREQAEGGGLRSACPGLRVGQYLPPGGGCSNLLAAEIPGMEPHLWIKILFFAERVLGAFFTIWLLLAIVGGMVR